MGKFILFDWSWRWLIIKWKTCWIFCQTMWVLGLIWSICGNNWPLDEIRAVWVRSGHTAYIPEQSTDLGIPKRCTSRQQQNCFSFNRILWRLRRSFHSIELDLILIQTLHCCLWWYNCCYYAWILVRSRFFFQYS